MGKAAAALPHAGREQQAQASFAGLPHLADVCCIVPACTSQSFVAQAVPSAVPSAWGSLRRVHRDKLGVV